MTLPASRMLVSAVVACLIVCGDASAAEPQAGPAKSAALQWLEKAEEAANRMDAAQTEDGMTGSKVRVLQQIALTYVELGEIDKAKAKAAALPDEEHRSVLRWIPISLAHAGRFDEAVREAEAVNDVSSWAVVCVVIARKDIPKALALVERAPELRHDYILAHIVEEQVYAGDLKGAQGTADRIEAAFEKKSALHWLAAGRFVEHLPDGEARDAAGSGIDPDTMEANVASIAEKRAEAGDAGKAEQILSSLKDSDSRCRVLISIAEAHLKRNQKKESREATGRALKEAAAIDDPEMGAFLRAARLLKIAEIQVKAGDLDDAMKTIGLADKSGKEESKQWEDLGIGGGGVFAGMGGRKAIIGLMILAGKFDDAVKMATRKDGTLMPDMVPLLAEAYGARGMKKELAALLESTKSPEVECALYLAAAQGAAQKAKETSGR